MDSEEIPIDPQLLLHNAGMNTSTEEHESLCWATTSESFGNNNENASAGTAHNDSDESILEGKLNRIKWKYGEKTHDAVVYAMEKKYPLLSNVIERIKELAIEECLR